MKSNNEAIKHWSADERPREKMLHAGAAHLSNAELIAILINNGTRNKTAIELGREILSMAGNHLHTLGQASIKELMQIKGVGKAKAVIIAAALELGRRRQAAGPPQKMMIRSSKDIAVFLKAHLQDYSHEVFAVLYLNRANKVNHFEIISSGGITGTVADPRIIMKKALEEKAVSLILCHNHPSGNLKPSRADEEITLKIKEACRFLDITLLDHIIISEEGYFSFADEGLV